MNPFNTYHGYPAAYEPYEYTAPSAQTLNDRGDLAFSYDDSDSPVSKIMALIQARENRLQAIKDRKQFNQLAQSIMSQRKVYDTVMGGQMAGSYDPDELYKQAEKAANQPVEPSSAMNPDEFEATATKPFQFNTQQTGYGLALPLAFGSYAGGAALKNSPKLGKLGKVMMNVGQPDMYLLEKFGGKLAGKLGAKAGVKSMIPGLGWLSLALDAGSHATRLTDANGNPVQTYAGMARSGIDSFFNQSMGDNIASGVASTATQLITDLVLSPLDLIEKTGRAALTNEEIKYPWQ